MPGTTEGRVGGFNPEDFANTEWVLAKVGPSEEKLFAVLAREAKRRVGEFDAHGLANTAWAFAKAGQSDDKLFAVLARTAERRME